MSSTNDDRLAASVREAAHHIRHEADAAPREDRRTADAREQERLYAEQTGASRADFFRRKREIESREFDPEAPSADA